MVGDLAGSGVKLDFFAGETGRQTADVEKLGKGGGVFEVIDRCNFTAPTGFDPFLIVTG